MRKKSTVLSIRLWIVTVAFAFSLPAFAKTVITFEDKAVVARVTPGASTAWYSVIHHWKGYRLTISRHSTMLVDEDRDGVVRMALDGRPLNRALFIVVDLTNGDHAIAAPDHVKFRRKTLPPAAFHSRSSSKSARVVQEKEQLLVFFLARPGVGAWVSTVEDGSPADGDANSDGNVSALLESMKPVGLSPEAPFDLLRNDIVIAIAPRTLDVFDGRFVN
jgi:hypothetical protein